MPKVNPLAGTVGYWHRQMSDTAEKSWGAILDTAQGLGGATALYPKVADGLTWQGQIDPTTPMASFEDLRALVALGAGRGVRVCPVVVPRGHSPLEEARFHAQLALIAGCLVTDIEAGPLMWDSAPLAEILTYTAALRKFSGDAFLINQPDPRPWGFQDAHVQETLQDFDALAPQHYVGWVDPVLQVRWVDVQAEIASFQAIAALGLPMSVTLWGEGDPALPGAFWEAVHPTCWGFQVFKLGTMDVSHLSAFAAFSRPLAPQPKAPLDCAARLSLVAYVAGGSGVADLTAWLAGYADA